MDPGTWIYLIMLVVGTAYSMSNQPKQEKPTALTLDDAKIPSAEIGKSIPVLFGTREINDANVVWYGHLRTTAVKTKSGK